MLTVGSNKRGWMKQNSIILFCFILLATSSCVSTQPTVTKVTNFEQRIKVKRVSILPPKGNYGWIIANKSEEGIAFSGMNKNTGSSVVALVINSSIPDTIKTDDDFVNVFRQIREASYIDKRHETINNTADIEKNENKLCINYHILIKDKNAYTTSGYKEMMLEIYGKTCRDPKDKMYVVDTSYSERYENQNKTVDLKERALDFISTLNFENAN